MVERGKAIRGGQRKKTIVGQFAPRLTEMLESPAYRALSLSGHRVLARLEIELGHHAGHDNGKLPTTFDDFQTYGVHRQAIAPAIRELVALGFIEVIQAGRAGNAEWRRPSLYRLTYRHQELTQPTDDWRKITTIEEAELIANAARKASPEKQNPSGGNRTKGQYGNRTSNSEFHSTETTTTASVRKPPLLSISRGGVGSDTPSPQPTKGQAGDGAPRLATIGNVSTALLNSRLVRNGRARP